MARRLLWIAAGMLTGFVIGGTVYAVGLLVALTGR